MVGQCIILLDDVVELELVDSDSSSFGSTTVSLEQYESDRLYMWRVVNERGFVQSKRIESKTIKNNLMEECRRHLSTIMKSGLTAKTK